MSFNAGALIQAAPQIFGEVMGELSTLIATGVLAPGRPTEYDLADGPKALADWKPGPPSANWPCCPEKPLVPSR